MACAGALTIRASCSPAEQQDRRHGPQQLAGCDVDRRRAATEGAGQPVDEEKDAFLRKVVEDQDRGESLAPFNTARLYDDGIMRPTRQPDRPRIALSACHSAEVRGARGFGVFRM